MASAALQNSFYFALKHCHMGVGEIYELKEPYMLRTRLGVRAK